MSFHRILAGDPASCTRQETLHSVPSAMQTRVADQSRVEQKAEANGASRPADERQELQSEEQAQEVASDIKKDAEAKGEEVQVHNAPWHCCLAICTAWCSPCLHHCPLQNAGGMAAFLPTWLAK